MDAAILFVYTATQTGISVRVIRRPTFIHFFQKMWKWLLNWEKNSVNFIVTYYTMLARIKLSNYVWKFILIIASIDIRRYVEDCPMLMRERIMGWCWCSRHYWSFNVSVKKTNNNPKIRSDRLLGSWIMCSAFTQTVLLKSKRDER